jgi:TPR repeat protein
MSRRSPIFWCALVLIIFTSPALAERRVALVIGNSAYQNITRLENPSNDASLMAETLKGLGFALVGDGAQLDLEKTALDTAVQKFGRQLQGADVALFYYAGHGVQVRGSNYLVPVNANPTREADVDFQMVDINVVMNQMQGSGTRLNLVILDACRNNPFGGRGLRSSEGGLAQIRAPEGSFISYATQPGSVAQDGDDGHSPYTRALASTIRRSGLDIFQTFNEVGLAVKRTTGGSQQPWVSSSPIDGNFYFVSPPASAATAPSPAPQQEARLSEPSDSLHRDLQTECDRLAASPLDEQRPRGIVGVQPAQIDIVPALAACDAAMRDFPDVARFAYQAGRVAGQQKDFVRARELYEKAASKGNIASANNLGALYNEGNGVAKDYGTARAWFEKAANGGFPRAMANLGRLYQNGQGVAVDFVEARKWYQKAAAANDAFGLSSLGYLYEKGTGVPKDFALARKWYDKAAEEGSTGALVNIGNLYRDGNGVTQDFAEARKWYEKAANSVEPNAMGLNNIGALYAMGQGTPKDFTEARRWYEKAVALGLPRAMTNLGYLYRDGNGVDKGLVEARNWFEKAAAAGDPNGMNALGLLYEKGMGVSSDLVEARKWYEKAAASGLPLALTNIGILYRDGNGVTKDLVEARKWFEKAVAAGDANGMNALGFFYEKGMGVAVDYSEARRWYEKGAALGQNIAMSNLGNLYRDGRGVQKDLVEARKWYEKSAAAGRTYAMVSLGMMYQNGSGVPKDLTQARKWYEMAVAAGDESAKISLKKLDVGGAR